MIDPSVSLAMSVQANPGAYAVLVGSGVSRTSGIPTGWGIVCDLITRVAKMQGEDVGDDPEGWYEKRYGAEPDYSKLLLEVAGTPTERSRLLRSYFEPTDEERARGLKAPTPAHRAMARLAKGGFIRMFITTNFDRLLEQALGDENIVPTVIATPDDLEGAPPLSSTDVTIVKVHGDYVDCRIKNTPAELAAYDLAIDALLDRIIADYGFIMVGWSGTWDKALVAAFLRAGPPRYGTWWANRRPPKGPGAKLLAARRGEFAQLSGADEFFTELAERVIDRGGGADDVLKTATARDNLPAQLSSFVGREDDIAAINDLLDNNRLVTLHALGGGGKTRTAIEVARRRSSQHADGVSFVDLSVLVDPERVPETISHALGYGPEKLFAALRNRELLVVLDNCEHVVDAVVDFLPDMMAAAPQVKVLATSRVPLGVPGEVVMALEPMVVPEPERVRSAELGEVESVQLFVERSCEVNTRWRFNDESAPHVARICRALDGHPLALELAAARVKVLSPEQIADRLDAGIELLKAGTRDAHPDRQKTLAAAWGWSWEALAEPSRLLFERLSVFRGGFSLDAVETVCSDDLVPGEDVLDLLAELIDYGLVIYAGEARYRLLEPVRQFAASKLAERGRSEAMVQRHAQYFMQLVGKIALKMNTDEGFILLSQAKGDLDNVRHAAAAVDRVTDPVTALMFHTPFGLFLWANQLEQEGDERLSRAIAAAPDVPPELQAAALLVMAYLRVGAADRQSSADAVAAARQAWDAIGDPARRAECCELAAIHALIENDLPGAERAAREGLEIAGPGAFNRSLLYTWLSWSLRQQDKFEEAAAAASAAAKELAGSDDPYRNAWAIAARATLEEDQGNWEAVERCFEEQMDLLNRHGVPGVVGRGGITEHNAVIRAIRGHIDEALTLARIANEIFSTRDNRGLRMFFPALHRGDPKPGDTEKSLQRHYQRLKLPPLEGAADALIERLEELESRLDRLGRADKANECRLAIAALQEAVGLSDCDETSD